jgi:hypothetical protein
MARKPVTDMSAWPSLTLEGNLIAPAMVAQISEPKDDDETRQSYGIRKGLTIREEISTAFRVGQSHFDAFAKLENPSLEATRRFVHNFLHETFGFNDLASATGAVSFLAGGRVPIIVVPPADEKLDRRSPALSTDRARSPAFALQDCLNDTDHALWGLVTNSVVIRLMRDNASLTRPAYVEADLAQIFTNEDAASFAVLWLLIHRTRFGIAGAPPADCALERWRDTGLREGEVARNRLADQVEIALKVLGAGFLEANPVLAAKLKYGEVNLTEWFNELLRLVYRLIFLMVAEDRNLLHPERAKPEARRLYADGYSLAALRTQCFRRATWDKHHDRYEGIKVVFRSLAHGQASLALPALGGIFAEDRLPHLETARLRNRAFMEALYRLSWLSDRTSMVPVNWRAMETEELGSVYESLLEIQPQLGDDGRTLVFASEAAEQRGNQRKTTGSYYTPDSLVQALLDTALDPVLDRTEAEADDPAKALLKLSVVDPAVGSGHFLLAAARRIATRLASIRAEGTPSLADFRHALRDVARCCLYGVDRNPMAVELTKVALWIETVDPGLPLGFFDAQIRCGESLLGVFDLTALQAGIPDAAYKPLAGDDRDTARYYLQANRAAKSGQGGFDFSTGQAAMPAMKPLALDFSGFRDLPEDTVEQIGAKAARFEDLRKRQAFVRAKAAADLYVAAFLLPKTRGAPSGASARTVPTTEELWMALEQGKIREAMMEAPKAASRARAFHWPLEFPDVMAKGGFDVTLGNPPWERIKLQEQEFFATRSPEIAGAPNKAARERLIKSLEKASKGTKERMLFDDFMMAKREAEASSEFVRVPGGEGGRFALANAPVLIDEGKGAEGNPWGVSFARLFDMSNDSGLFRTAAALAEAGFQREGADWVADSEHYVPLYEAKMISYFDHRAAGYGARGDDRGFRVLPEASPKEHEDPYFELTPFYWVETAEVERRLNAMGWHQGWCVGFKDITSAVSERTFIPTLLPRCGAGNSLPLILPGIISSAPLVCGLTANLSALSLDFVVRQKAGGLHMNFFYVKQFPVLAPHYYTDARLAFIVPRVLELTYTSHSLTPFARDLCHDGPPFVWDEDRRAHLRADLDAFYARAYSLDRDELRYILDPADVKGADYPSETFRVLKEKEIRAHDEYRTRRLVLEAWDRMEADGTFKAMGM